MRIDANPQQELSLFVCSVLVVLLAPLVSGCSLFSSECEEVEHEACGGGFSDRVRIIPGKGVDGIEFGDSIEDVHEKLGPSGLGWMDGLYRGWRTHYYDKGPHAGLLIGFLIQQDGATPGPVDTFILFREYRGRSERGIGIGSSLEDVKRAYGTPAHMPEGGGDGHYTYCFGERRLTLGVRSDSVSVMNMGYYVSMPEGETQHCE